MRSTPHAGERAAPCHSAAVWTVEGWGIKAKQVKPIRTSKVRALVRARDGGGGGAKLHKTIKPKVCCGMLRHASNPPPVPKIRCCGMRQPLVLAQGSDALVLDLCDGGYGLQRNLQLHSKNATRPAEPPSVLPTLPQVFPTHPHIPHTRRGGVHPPNFTVWG